MIENAILEAIQKRPANRWGVRTAHDYLSGLHSCLGDPTCAATQGKLATGDQWAKALEEGKSRLVYSDDEMTLDTKATEIKATSGSILDFACILTSTQRDRDYDVLETSGARVDMKMPLLWQHVPFEPIGKLVSVLAKTKEKLFCHFAVADTPLGRDAATLIEFGALRMSHGFRPEEFEPLKEKDGLGWWIKVFEIIEGSCVSIPSNTSAVITAVSREKLHHPIVKAWAQRAWDAKPKQVVGGYIARETLGEWSIEVTAPTAEDAAQMLERVGKKDACQCHEKAKLSADEIESLGKDFIKQILDGWDAGKCGGEGSGVPGPCPQGGDSAAADAAAKSWTDLAKGIPAAVYDKAKAKVQKVYGKFEARYGRAAAIAIVAAGIVGTAIPLPGTTVLAMAPVVGAAELYVRLRGDKATVVPEKAGRSLSAKNRELLADSKELIDDVHDHPKTKPLHKSACKEASGCVKDVIGEEEKAGKVLSKANVAKIKQAHDLCNEMAEHAEMHRGGKSALREARTDLKAVLDAAGEEGEDEKEKSPSTSAAGKDATPDGTKVNVQIDGSWEWVYGQLSKSLKHFLMTKFLIPEYGYAYIEAMFPDSAIVCRDSNPMAAWKCQWTMVDGMPAWTGEPSEVRITAKIEELEKRWEGRFLAKALAGALSADATDLLLQATDTLRERQDAARENEAMEGLKRLVAGQLAVV